MWIFEMVREEILLLAAFHPYYTKNSYHSPLTRYQPQHKQADNSGRSGQKIHYQ